MAQEERLGFRDLTYSHWHRRDSTERYLGRENAQILSMIDIDGAEYDQITKKVVGLVETALDVGQMHKNCAVMRNLANAAQIPAFTVLYTPSVLMSSNPSLPDIEAFRIRQVAPFNTDWMMLSPSEWAQKLLSLRQR